MRGASVIGASFWDSGNRWLTVHGTNYLVVRDCVGYQSVGHGFFLEDGTEQFNVFERNLAVQAMAGKPLPEQVLPYDLNDGAGYWWANSRNAFLRNVAAECDEYGFRFDVVKSVRFDPVLRVADADGALNPTDIRTVPFLRFDGNESHCQRRHAFNLGGFDANLSGGVGGVGPDTAHPFLVSNLRVWNAHWAFHPMSPSLLLDGFDAYNVEYALWNPNYTNHAYRNVSIGAVTVVEEFQPKGKRPDEANYPKPLV